MAVTAKISVFIGCSSRSLVAARALKRSLKDHAHVRIWTENLFSVSKSTLDGLLHIANSFDFGVFIFAPDDLVRKRGMSVSTTRDNVIFECGMFFGSAGVSR